MKAGSFAAWNRTRKKAVQQAVETCETPPRKPSAVVTASSKKESDYQRKQTLKRKAEALQDGLLLADEVTDAVKMEAQRIVKANRQHDRIRAKQRKDYESGARLVSKLRSHEWACQGLSGPVWCCRTLGAERAAVVQALQVRGVTHLTQDIQTLSSY